MVVLDTDGKLDIDDLPPELSDPTPLLEYHPSVSSAANLSHRTMESGSTSESAANASHGLGNGKGSEGPSELVGQTMDSIERWAIEETLKLTAGNREEAAKILDIGARTLYRKLDKYKHENE